MSLADFSTIDSVENAWREALCSPGGDLMRALLHPDFIAVHGPTGQIQDVDEFLSTTAARPPAVDVQTLSPTIRQIGDVVTVSCIDEIHAPFIPAATPFVIQAAVSRLWIRGDDGWRLAHLQMARRFPPA